MAKKFFLSLLSLYQIMSSVLVLETILALSIEFFGLKALKWETFHFRPVVISMIILIVPNLFYTLWKGFRRIKEIIR